MPSPLPESVVETRPVAGRRVPARALADSGRIAERIAGLARPTEAGAPDLGRYIAKVAQ
jgi:hypothetical protein